MGTQRGATLGTVLIAILAVTLITFVAAGNGLWDLRLSVAVNDKAHARNLADSAVALVLAEISKNEQYGKSGETLYAPVPTGLSDNSLGVVTFDPSVASDHGIPASINAIGSLSSTPASDGGSVPISAVRMVALGRSGSEIYRAECIFFRPPTANGVMASGAIRAEALFLAGLKNPTSFTGDWATTDPEEKREANLFSSRRDDGSASIKLEGGENEITGDAGTTGTLTIDEGSIVRGEIRQGVAPLKIPKFDLPEMIGRIQDVQGAWPFPPPSGDTEVVGLRYYDSSRSVSGDLKLDGVIAVTGDFRLSGRLQGQGAIIATGDVTLRGGSDLATENMIAIAAGGDLSIRGTSASNYFRGLLYTEGDLFAERITILGTAVANGPAGQGNMDLENVTLIQTDVSVSYNQGLPMWGSYAGGSIVEFEEVSDSDGCWVTQLDRKKVGNRFLYDVRMYYNNAASDFTEGDSDYESDGRANVYFSPEAGPAGWYFSDQGLTAEEAMDFIYNRIAPNQPGAFQYRDRLETYFADDGRHSASAPVLDFDLNSVLHPVDTAKIVRWSSYKSPD